MDYSKLEKCGDIGTKAVNLGYATHKWGIFGYDLWGIRTKGLNLVSSFGNALIYMLNILTSMDGHGLVCCASMVSYGT